MDADEPILQKCRAVLCSLYGDRLMGVVLYGSCARGEETGESDIDLMVLLDGPVNVAGEIRRIWDGLYPVQLESDKRISVLPADADRYHKGDSSLYRSIQEYGVAV